MGKASGWARSKLAVAVAASLAWMVASSGLIMLNKRLLSRGFTYPMALSGLGMAFSSVASYVTCRVSAAGVLVVVWEVVWPLGHGGR